MTVDKSGITSAGILLFRRSDRTIEVLLGHPGGPFWQTRDHGHWTVPKGEVEAGEAIVDVARREFAEETGQALGDGPLIPLGEIRQKSGKVVVAFATEGDLDPAFAHSNTFSIEWPPKSGQRTEFPELDRVAWFGLEEARARLKDAQVPFLDRLLAALGTAEGLEMPARTGVDPVGWDGRRPPVAALGRRGIRGTGAGATETAE